MGYGDGGSRGGPKISNSGGGGQSAEDAEQEAAERNLIRRCVDYHGPATIDLQDRLFRKACRSHHVRERPYIQDHSSYIRFLPMPIAQASFFTPSNFYLTYCAHVTRAKNSTPIICLSWTPGGRRLLTGNSEGQFTLWDGSTYLVWRVLCDWGIHSHTRFLPATISLSQFQLRTAHDSP